MRTRITPNMDTFYAVPDAVKILKKIQLLPIELKKTKRQSNSQRVTAVFATKVYIFAATT